MRQVNIIGAGLAGLSAAVTLAKQNITCHLVSLQPSERAQSILAAGGINAVLDTMGEHDTVDEHFQDTVRGGVDLADPNAILGMVKCAPEIVRELYRLGVPLQAENGTLIQRNFGGQKKKRTAYAKSSTGKMLMSALIDEARRLEAKGLILQYPHHEFLDLMTEQGRCIGCLIRDSYTGECLRFAGPVLLASGGINGIFGPYTTGTTQNTGDVTAVAFSHGVQMGNLEFVQCHPTTIAIPGKRMLISEAARGEGGRLFVRRGGKPWYFMEEKYPELGNLMPRDV
ncbi:MAG: FAD-binding protein, partial [Blautia sp.]|nr:FAD-binding protein [Blautia sp.]